MLTAPPSPPLGSDLPDRFFFVFDDTTTTTTAKGEGHAIVVRAFDSVSRKRSDHHHPTVGDLGSDRSKSRSRSKTQSSSPGPRLGSGGVLVLCSQVCILHFALGFPNGSRRRVLLRHPGPACISSLHQRQPGRYRTLQRCKTCQSSTSPTGQTPIPPIDSPVKSNLGQGDPSKAPQNALGRLVVSEKPSSSPSRLFIPEPSLHQGSVDRNFHLDGLWQPTTLDSL